MKESVIQRIKDYMSARSIGSIESFASLIGCNSNTLQRQMIGERSLSLDIVMSILMSDGSLSSEWLLRGEGPMYKGASNVNNFDIHTGSNNTQIVGNNNNNSAVTPETIQQLMKMQQQLIDYVTQR